MLKIAIVGEPNTGKRTLIDFITKKNKITAGAIKIVNPKYAKIIINTFNNILYYKPKYVNVLTKTDLLNYKIINTIKLVTGCLEFTTKELNSFIIYLNFKILEYKKYIAKKYIKKFNNITKLIKSPTPNCIILTRNIKKEDNKIYYARNYLACGDLEIFTEKNKLSDVYFGTYTIFKNNLFKLPIWRTSIIFSSCGL